MFKFISVLCLTMVILSAVHGQDQGKLIRLERMNKELELAVSQTCKVTIDNDVQECMKKYHEMYHIDEKNVAQEMSNAHQNHDQAQLDRLWDSILPRLCCGMWFGTDCVTPLIKVKNNNPVI